MFEIPPSQHSSSIPLILTAEAAARWDLRGLSILLVRISMNPLGGFILVEGCSNIETCTAKNSINWVTEQVSWTDPEPWRQWNLEQVELKIRDHQ